MLTPFINRLTIAVHVRSRAKRIESGQPKAARFAMPMRGDNKASHDGAYLASSYFDQDSLVIGTEYDNPISARWAMRPYRSGGRRMSIVCT
ncbi:hypothetical protein D7S91_26775 [Burkholderia contaminans]|jgi:hypothetical protein|nr:hypothetical protein [Burkholderia contaminans]MBA9865329.1 hypothetical protein [Burkholderia contaminans]MBA9908212.1 hypothetical protein [Burkholderia contaminans]MBA9934730.1 hypothetical protein [Burkholderia contaminans]MCB4329285.1 hypothetical protein [Burkholderia contaminans]